MSELINVHYDLLGWLVEPSATGPDSIQLIPTENILRKQQSVMAQYIPRGQTLAQGQKSIARISESVKQVGLIAIVFLFKKANWKKQNVRLCISSDDRVIWACVISSPALSLSLHTAARQGLTPGHKLYWDKLWK